VPDSFYVDLLIHPRRIKLRLQNGRALETSMDQLVKPRGQSHGQSYFGGSRTILLSFLLFIFIFFPTLGKSDKWRLKFAKMPVARMQRPAFRPKLAGESNRDGYCSWHWGPLRCRR